MIIVGIGTLAKEMLYFLKHESIYDEIIFFVEPKYENSSKFMDKYNVINNYDKLEKYIKNTDKEFFVAVQHNKSRERIVNKIEGLGGELVTLVSKDLYLLSYDNIEYKKVLIQPYSAIHHNVSIGKGCLIEPFSKIGHDVILEDYVFVGPDALILGPSVICKHTYVGARSIILSGLNIGKNVVIGAGAIVDRNLKDNEVFISNRIL